MNSSQSQKSEIEILEHIYSVVTAAPKEQWDRLLDELCADQDIRDEIIKLLELGTGSDQLLDRSLYPEPAKYVIGDQIGNYHLLEEIGHGGMGVVFRAEQTQPVQRVVALKVIKPGFDTREVITRFDAERQALSMMNHPNIAKVLDAGSTESGHPYFVMELVDGQPISNFVQNKPLTVRQKLELFLPVCQAIQHAHHKGIIHRDIKPSNVLVTEIDGRPVAKVIDFGIAKAIRGATAGITMFTGFNKVVGTFEYMSPEQAQLDHPDIDTRSDIYSLGVLLYELLVGAPPFDKKRLRNASWNEMLKIICEEEPPRPSTQIAAFTATRSNTTDRTTMSELHRSLDGELDWIILKAIEKDRNRRYDSPAALASDIQRFMTGQEVVACPPSAIYRFRKFAKRNKVAISTSTIVLASLIIGLVGTSWQAVRASRAEGDALEQARQAQAATEAEISARQAETQARLKAEAAEEKANQEAVVANAISDFLEQDLLGLAGAEAQLSAGLKPDPQLKLVTLLERARLQIDERFTDLPAVRNRLKSTVANSFHRIGRYQDAASMLEDVLNEQQHQQTHDTSKTMTKLAVNYIRLEKFDQAAELFAAALKLNQKLFGDEHLSTAEALNNLGGLLHSRGQTAEAVRRYEQCLAIQKKILGNEHIHVVRTIHNLGLAYQTLNRMQAAEDHLTESARISRQKLPGDPRTATQLVSLAKLHHQLGVQQNDHDRYSQAESLLNESLEILKRTRGLEHPATISTLQILARLFVTTGRFDQAANILEETLPTTQRLHGRIHEGSIVAIQNLGTAYFNQKKYVPAEKFLSKALELRREKSGDNHPSVIKGMNELSLLDRRLGKLERSAKRAEESLNLSRDVLGESHPQTLSIMINLGATYLRQKRTEDGIALLEDAANSGKEFYGLNWAEGLLADSYSRQRKSKETIFWTRREMDRARKKMKVPSIEFSSLLAQTGERLMRVKAWEQAEEVLSQFLEQSEEQRADEKLTGLVQSMLGAVYTRQNKFEEAETLLTAGYQSLTNQRNSNHDPRLQLVTTWLVQLYQATDNKELEEKYRQIRSHLQSQPDQLP